MKGVCEVRRMCIFFVFAIGDHLNRIVWCDVICCAFFVASM